MNESFRGFSGFFRGLCSEKDGTPSSSRFLMGFKDAVGAAVILILALTVRNGEPSKASLILAALPAILAALALWQTSGYVTNRLSSKKAEEIQAGQNGPVDPKA
jgi:hypothetical protein